MNGKCKQIPVTFGAQCGASQLIAVNAISGALGTLYIHICSIQFQWEIVHPVPMGNCASGVQQGNCASSVQRGKYASSLQPGNYAAEHGLTDL